MATFTQYELDPCRKALGLEIHKTLSAMAPEGVKLSLGPNDIGRLLEQPPDNKLGDYALPCFRFAKDLKKKPPEVAEGLAAGLKPGGWLDRTQVVGAFMNVFTNKRLLAESVVPEVLAGRAMGRQANNAANAKQKVMIEYSQPNTHKEFHVGHGRNVCLGNALVRLFRRVGYQLTSANYFGDDGVHIATVLWYLQRTKKAAPAAHKGVWLGQMYAESKRLIGDAPEAEKKAMLAEISVIHRQIETRTGDVYKTWQETRQWSLDDFAEIYKQLDVHFDVLFYESELSEAAQAIVEEQLKKGVFALDQGAVGVDLKPYKLGYCILRKSDGNTLYATKDLVLARIKFDKYKIDRSFYVVADEQNHHFKQVFKVLELMGVPQAKDCHHLTYGMVVLPEGKMSSRDGTAVSFLTLRDMMLQELRVLLKKYEGDWSDAEISETARLLCDGALKYGMVSTDPVKEIVFNFEDWLSFEGNSGPYLMYGYTRTQSILRKATEQGVKADPSKASLLTAPSEHELLRFLYDYGDTVVAAAENYKPSLLASHLFHMCKSFNRFYVDVPVLKADSPELRGARLALIDSFARVLGDGLSLLGISPPIRM